MKIRTLIVDDEPLAREKIRTLLRNEPDIELVGECGDGAAAVESIIRLAPELVFLDVQMPEVDGFDVLDAIGAEHSPAVVFVTAYDRHALRAFEVHALDYLLKPFDRERFTATLERARRELRRDRAGDGMHRDVEALLVELRAERRGVARIVVKERGRVFFLRTDEIDWIEAQGNYLELHSGTARHLVRETMRSLEQRLDPERFLRVHRSAIVNVARIQQLRPGAHGDYTVVLESGVELTSSRGYSERLRKLVEKT